MKVSQSIVNSITIDNNPNIIIDSFDLSIGNTQLFANAELRIIKGQKYGLVGRNGIGKSTLLKAISSKYLKIPNHIDILHLEQEPIIAEGTIIEYMMHLYHIDDDDYDIQKAKAHHILYGLGFNNHLQHSPAISLSGGWKMRLSLAMALFISPTLLLLDEPTNHLDLYAIMWLEEYLSNSKSTLLMVSHNVHFLNSVCNKTIYVANQKLTYYKGNYNSFKQVRQTELIKEQKAYNLYLKQLKKNKNTLIVSRPEKEYIVNIHFNNVELLTTSILEFSGVSYRYDGAEKYLFTDLHFGLYLNSTIAIIGQNGVGKSTLLKLLANKLPCLEGTITTHNRLRIGYLTQHVIEEIPLDATPISYLMNLHGLKYQDARKALGCMGVKPKSHEIANRYLSGGEKMRVALVSITLSEPNLLILDEPTNNLDIESIESLSDAINAFNGCTILVSHDQQLIEQLDCEIWLLQDGNIQSYTDNLSELVDKK